VMGLVFRRGWKSGSESQVESEAATLDAEAPSRSPDGVGTIGAIHGRPIVVKVAVHMRGHVERRTMVSSRVGRYEMRTSPTRSMISPTRSMMVTRGAGTMRAGPSGNRGEDHNGNDGASECFPLHGSLLRVR
jgi:hypothetical protein